MPVDFLTNEQRQRYGRYVSEPTKEQLARYFYLSDSDRAIVAERRRSHNRLGFALQLTTLRFLGLFLGDPLAVPREAIRYVADQIGIADLSELRFYADRTQTQWDHQAEIRTRFHYSDWHDPAGGFRLIRYLYAREWVSAERPIVLFDRALLWLVEHKIILPGISVLERTISQVRDRVAERIWSYLSALVPEEQRKNLERLLEHEGKDRITLLERLRRSPTHASSKTMVAALSRLEEVRQLAVREFDLEKISPQRIGTLAGFALTSKNAHLARLPDDQRAATLLCCAKALEITAQDDALDVLEMLLRDVLANAEQKGKKARLRSLRDLDGAALHLAEHMKHLLTGAASEEELRAYVLSHKPPLESSIEVVYRLARPADDHYYPEVAERYKTIRAFLPHLLKHIVFQSNKRGEPLIRGLSFLQELEGQKHPSMKGAPLGFVTPGWKRYVAPYHQTPDRRSYTLCLFSCLHGALKRRDVFVEYSHRWGDPRIKLVTGSEWERVRSPVCQALGRHLLAQEELAEMGTRLHEGYLRAASHLPNEKVRVEQERVKNGKIQERLSLTGLEKPEETPSLRWLRPLVSRQLPLIHLPELLLEIHVRTGFLSEFTHISEQKSRMDEVLTSLCAVLMAEACNIGFVPLIEEGIPALERDRLSYIQQTYIRPETLSRANACLVDYQTTIPLAQVWGGGEVASADGLRFVVPVRTLNAAPNSKYFGTGRGLYVIWNLNVSENCQITCIMWTWDDQREGQFHIITLMNYTSDQFSGFYNIVVSGTLKDSLVVLAGLLNQETKLDPKVLMTDTGSYSDVVFGLFYLLGYRFSPHLADRGSTRYWRIDPTANYGVLNGIARHQINTKLIESNWDDVLRVAASLKLGKVGPIELMKTFQSGSGSSTLARAIAEVGRIDKTTFLLSQLHDEAAQRQQRVQLNKGEGRHGVARHVFHGQKGELRQRYREGQEEQLSALGLVVNAIILWNTIYMDRTLEEMRQKGLTILAEDVAHLWPLRYDHIQVHGKYSFAIPDSIKQGKFLPLRSLQEHDEATERTTFVSET